MEQKKVHDFDRYIYGILAFLKSNSTPRKIKKEEQAIFHVMYNQYGAETTVQCLTKLQRIGCIKMFTMSLSTGIKNFVLDKNIIKLLSIRRVLGRWGR